MRRPLVADALLRRGEPPTNDVVEGLPYNHVPSTGWVEPIGHEQRSLVVGTRREDSVVVEEDHVLALRSCRLGLDLHGRVVRLHFLVGAIVVRRNDSRDDQ